MVGLSSAGVVEYVVESTYGVFPTNPTMLEIGLIQKADIVMKNENEDYRGLKDAASTNKLEIMGNWKSGANIDVSLEFQPRNFNFLKYATSSTGGNSMTDAYPVGLSLGLISADATPKYAKVTGGQIDSFEMSVDEDKLAKVVSKLIMADIPGLATNDIWSTDYKGSGTHYTDSGALPLGWADITTFTLGGAAIRATSLKFGVKNNAQRVKAVGSSKWTKVEAIVPQKRDITFSCKVRRDAINDYAVRNFGYGANNIVLTIGGSTLTFANAHVPQEAYNFASEGLSEMDINFTGITSLTYS